MRHDDSLTSLGHLLFLTPQTLPFSFIFCATYKPLILRRKCLSSSRNLKPYKLLSHISSCICTHSYLQSERMWCPFFYARSSPSSLPGSLPSKPCSRKKEEKKKNPLYYLQHFPFKRGFLPSASKYTEFSPICKKQIYNNKTKQQQIFLNPVILLITNYCPLYPKPSL